MADSSLDGPKIGLFFYVCYRWYGLSVRAGFSISVTFCFSVRVLFDLFKAGRF